MPDLTMCAATCPASRTCRRHEDSAQPFIVIDLNEERHWGDCPMCDEYRRLNHAVAWYCGPTHDEIGSVTTEYTDGGIVGGMSVCQPCHDRFYAKDRQSWADFRPARDASGSGCGDYLPRRDEDGWRSPPAQ